MFEFGKVKRTSIIVLSFVTYFGYDLIFQNIKHNDLERTHRLLIENKTSNIFSNKEELFTLRINCGGSKYIDSLGQTWITDNYYNGGIAVTGKTVFPLIRPHNYDPIMSSYRDDSFLFSLFGKDDLKYTISGLKSGTYTVILHMVADRAGYYLKSHLPLGSRRNTFNVAIEDEVVFEDINVKLLPKENNSDENFNKRNIRTLRTQKGIVVDDGVLTIKFYSKGTRNPPIAAIEIYQTSFAITTPTSTPMSQIIPAPVSNPVKPPTVAPVITSLPVAVPFAAPVIISPPSPRMNPIYINVGSDKPYIAFDNVTTWMEDTYFVGGQTSKKPMVIINNTNDPFLYQTERWGEFNYSIPLEANRGKYRVVFHFTDFFHQLVGERIFDIIIENKYIIRNLDILELTPGNLVRNVLKLTYRIEITDNELSLRFVKGKAGLPSLVAIEVHPISATSITSILRPY